MHSSSPDSRQSVVLLHIPHLHVHHKQDGSQQFVHSLSVPQFLVLLHIAEQNVLHHLPGDVIKNECDVMMMLLFSLDVVLSEELDIGECANDILTD